MKYIPIVVGALLGLLFVASSVPILIGKMPAPPPNLPLDAIKFMEVFAGSGWLIFVKVCELIGGILVAVPKVRNFGLLVLGPIVLNILVYNAMVMKDPANPINIFIGVASFYLLWDARQKFAGLLN